MRDGLVVQVPDVNLVVPTAGHNLGSGSVVIQGPDPTLKVRKIIVELVELFNSTFQNISFENSFFEIEQTSPTVVC